MDLFNFAELIEIRGKLYLPTNSLLRAHLPLL